MSLYTITVTCPDRKGIVAAIAGLMSKKAINILDLTQHTASDIGLFMFKSLFEAPEGFDKDDFGAAFGLLAKEYLMDWQLYEKAIKQRLAILVSKTTHCLWEILLKHADGELNCDISVIISNHSDNQRVADQFGIPYHHIDYGNGKLEAEDKLNHVLNSYKTDAVVMARFMQILSSNFIGHWRNRVINIHHGFLPAFQGAKPYHQAWNKGVKIIGATAHFASEELDQGPIIAQEVINVTDKSSIEELVQMGKDVERRTLVHALQRYLDHSVFLYENRTFVLN